MNTTRQQSPAAFGCSETFLLPVDTRVIQHITSQYGKGRRAGSSEPKLKRCGQSFYTISRQAHLPALSTRLNGKPPFHFS